MPLEPLPVPSRPSPSTVLWTFSWPFFLFSAVLAGILMLSWSLLLPRFTKISVEGVPRDAEELRMHKLELTARIAQKEEERRLLVLAVNDPAYEALKGKRRERVTLESLRERLTAHAKTAVGRQGAVHIRSFDYVPSKRTITIGGDIRNVGASSMTVLAAYAESLKDVPFVKSATTPAFSREEDKVIGLYSPFSIVLTLK